MRAAAGSLRWLLRHELRLVWRGLGMRQAWALALIGGAAFVAFKSTKNPKEVARWLEWLASKPVYAEWMAMTNNIPGHQDLQKGGVDYKLAPAGIAAIKAFALNATTLSPVAYKLVGNPLSGSIYTATAERVSQAMSGQITLDQAFARITQDVADAAAAAAKK